MTHLPSFEIWIAPEQVAHLREALQKAGATLVGQDALELYRIALGIPRYGKDIRERDLPQETEQQRALNFSKGCYVGQEIVERIRSRGNVHRKFTGFKIDGAAADRRHKDSVRKARKSARLPVPRSSPCLRASKPWRSVICAANSPGQVKSWTSPEAA